LRPAGEWRELGTLELCTILRSVHREILRKTGMEPEQFIDGMRELLAPAVGVSQVLTRVSHGEES
jgi:hypothetical protein